MILFIFEGKDDEPRLYKTLKELFWFDFHEEELLHCFCNNIFSLLDTLKSYSEEELDESVDIINVLKEDASAHKKSNADLDKIKYSADVSEIFLFFDYDVKPMDKNNKLSVEEQNRRILELFDYFDVSERNGIKLYLSYPMLESYRYFKLPLPDERYKEYTFSVLARNFKQAVNDFSGYKNLKYLCYRPNERGALGPSEDMERKERIKENWRHIKDMNIKKANYICSNDYSIPQDKGMVSQRNILESQMARYIHPQGEVAILNAFPLFWYEYVDESKL